MGFSLTTIRHRIAAAIAPKAAKPSPEHRQFVRLGFDALKRSDENRRQRENLDYLSPNAQLTPEVRREMRALARYETANNSYCRGIITTLANDCVGRGPRLQLLTRDPGLNNTLEAAFMAWARAIDLDSKLRTMRMAKAVDGEAFAMLTTNPELQSEVLLDLQLIEADRITTPLQRAMAHSGSDQAVDGIEFDQFGNPKTYYLLRVHPGGGFGPSEQFDLVRASSMLHVFRVDRPGQSRGISELMPALPLFEQLRRYTLAVLGAAEVAADWAGILYTDAPADGAQEGNPFEPVELERRMLITAPAGYRMEQIKAEQPTTTYGDFKHQILNEACRCFCMPFVVAAGNSERSNFASARLDHQTYFRAIGVERRVFELKVLDRILAAWLTEAALSVASLPRELRDSMRVPHQWFWDGHEHVDPLKEEKAITERIAGGRSNRAIECGKLGHDWEEIQDQELIEIARRQRRMRELGIEPEPANTSNSPSEEEVNVADDN